MPVTPSPAKGGEETEGASKGRDDHPIYVIDTDGVEGNKEQGLIKPLFAADDDTPPRRAQVPGWGRPEVLPPPAGLIWTDPSNRRVVQRLITEFYPPVDKGSN